MSVIFTLFFEPLDVLQFRDARPFDAGLHVHARSVFPLPSVFLGAIRTALLRQAGVDFGRRPFHVPKEWSTLLGDATEHAKFRLRGPLLAYRTRDVGLVEPRFPAPADLYRRDEAEFDVLEAAAPEDWGFARWRWQADELARQADAVPWTSAQLAKDTSGALWLAPGGARAYLAHACGGPLTFEDGEALQADAIFEHEARTGIARDEGTLTTLEGLFYVTTPFRLRSDAGGGYGFAVDLRLPETLGTLLPEQAEEALRALDGSVVPLGGKAHRALVRVTPGALLPTDLSGEAAPLAAGRARKLWLVTPLPWNERGPQVTLGVGGRPARVGGFDFARRAPRPLLRALPAGTVLVADGDVCEHLSEDQRLAGYGTALVKGL